MRPQPQRNQRAPRFPTRSQKLNAKRARRKARRAVRTNTQIQDKLIAYGHLIQKGREQFTMLIQRGAEVTYRESIEGE